MKQASEQHIGTIRYRDSVTGAPVIELGYKPFFRMAVPDKVNMVTY